MIRYAQNPIIFLINNGARPGAAIRVGYPAPAAAPAACLPAPACRLHRAPRRNLTAPFFLALSPVTRPWSRSCSGG